MIGSMSSAPVRQGWMEDRERMRAELAALCGLSPERSVESCGQRWCVHYDDATRRCALLTFDVAGRLGPQALRWFAKHRVSRTPGVTESPDDVLAARCASL